MWISERSIIDKLGLVAGEQPKHNKADGRERAQQTGNEIMMTPGHRRDRPRPGDRTCRRHQAKVLSICLVQVITSVRSFMPKTP
jgi:hypothetical protein